MTIHKLNSGYFAAIDKEFSYTSGQGNILVYKIEGKPLLKLRS